jgi:hypothetical protein
LQSGIVERRAVLVLDHATLLSDQPGGSETVTVNMTLHAGELALIHVEHLQRALTFADTCSGLVSPAPGHVLFLNQDWARVPPDLANALRGAHWTGVCHQHLAAASVAARQRGAASAASYTPPVCRVARRGGATRRTLWVAWFPCWLPPGLHARRPPARCLCRLFSWQSGAAAAGGADLQRLPSGTTCRYRRPRVIVWSAGSLWRCTGRYAYAGDRFSLYERGRWGSRVGDRADFCPGTGAGWSPSGMVRSRCHDQGYSAR